MCHNLKTLLLKIIITAGREVYEDSSDRSEHQIAETVNHWIDSKTKSTPLPSIYLDRWCWVIHMAAPL